MYFLVEYDRVAGKLVQLRQYDQSEMARAHEDRLSAELAGFKRGVAMEIVLLEAENQAALQRTHRRYFGTLDELSSGVA